MGEARIRLDSDGDTGRLIWDEIPQASVLEAALRGLDEPGIPLPRRVEIDLGPGARRLRHLLHRHGFRLEGVARQAGRGPSGDWGDVLRYARLIGDPVADRMAFTAVMNSVTARKRLIAHALVTDTERRVLLCETSFKPDWELPGGIVEPGEPPWAGCRREMIEEMGHAPALRGVLVMDWLRPFLGWEDAVELVFDTEPVPLADRRLFVPDGHEIVGLHWLDADEAASRMTSFGAARLRAAIDARADGQVRCTEGGEPPPSIVDAGD